METLIHSLHRARVAPLAGMLPRAAGGAMAVLVLRGMLRWETPGHVALLPPGSVIIDDGRAVQSLSGHAVGQVEVLCVWAAGNDTWLPLVHEPEAPFAAAMQRCAESLSRAGLRRLQGEGLQPVIDAWRDAERECDARIARCHGRTPERRRDLFVRLARARALLALPGADLDIAACARVARLSPCHFVRVFHKAFEDSPHRYRSRGRMQWARQLIEETDLPVREVMRRVGYSSAPIFSRVFRQHHGASATAVRSAGMRRALPVVARIASRPGPL